MSQILSHRSVVSHMVEHKDIEVRDKMRQLQEELGVESDEEIGSDDDGEDSHELFGSRHADFKQFMQRKQYVLHSRIALIDCNCESLTDCLFAWCACMLCNSPACFCRVHYSPRT